MLQPRIPWAASGPCTCLRLAIRTYATKKKANPKDAPSKRSQAAKGPRAAIATDEAVYIQPSHNKTTSGGGFQLRSYKPRTPGVRHLRRPINDHLWKGRPVRKLTIAKKGQGLGGRNNTGRITVRHRGGGHKRRIRIVDFQRKDPGAHTVNRIEHDPGRSAHIALVTNNKTGAQSYIVAAEGMREGDTVESYRKGLPDELIKSMGGSVDPGMLAARTAIRGNCMPIRMVPMGTQVYNVGSTINKGGVFCRSAGTFAIVISKQEDENSVREVVVRMQSGELRRVSPEACCTVGVASNPHHHFRQLGKAGRKRWLGIRPTVRGVAMNASELTDPPICMCPALTQIFRGPSPRRWTR